MKVRYGFAGAEDPKSFTNVGSQWKDHPPHGAKFPWYVYIHPFFDTRRQKPMNSSPDQKK